MKKVLLLTTLLILAVAGMARAESISLAGNTITYEIPKGYVKADGGKYKQILTLMRQSVPQGLTIHAMYVPEDVDRQFGNSDQSGLRRYMVVTSLRQLAGKNITVKDFKELKAQIKHSFGGRADTDLREQANELLKKNIPGQAQIDSLKSLGTFGETDTRISYMQLQTITGPDNKTGKQAIISTQLLTNGKLVIVGQYAPAEDPKEITDLCEQTPAVLQSMQFKEGAAPGAASGTGRSAGGSSVGSSSARSTGSSGGSKMTIRKRYANFDNIWQPAIAVILALGIGGAATYFSKKKKGEITRTPAGEKPDFKDMTAETRETIQRIFKKDKTEL